MLQKSIILTLIISLTFSVNCFAIDISFHGDFNNRFSYSNQADINTSFSKDLGQYINVTDAQMATGKTDKSSDDKDYFGEIKYRLWMNAEDAENNLKGVLGFEFGGLKYGQESGADFGGDDNTFELRWAYVDWAVLANNKTHISMGLQPVKYHKWLWNDNAAGVKLSSSQAGVDYSFGVWLDDVANKGKGGATKDQNAVVLTAEGKYKFNDTSGASAFYFHRDGGEGKTALKGTAETYEDSENWFGLTYGTKWKNFSIDATAIYLTGTIDATTAFENGATELDRKAYLANLEGTCKLEKTTLKLGWLYASGDDDPNDNDVENFEDIDASSSPFGSVVLFSSYADDNYFMGTPYLRDRGLNVVYLHGAYKLNAKSTVGAGYIFANTATEVINETDLGHEFIARYQYNVSKNLSARIAAGYLVGGGAWDELSATGQGDNVIRTDASIRFKF